MTVRDSSKFKIRPTDESSLGDSLLTEQIEFARFEKLSQRVTIITILIPILIGVMVFVGYRDIREMVSQTQDMGVKEMTSLAQSLESTISNLSIKQAKLEETLAGKIAEQEKIEKTVQGSIKKMEAMVQDSIKKMDATVQGSVKKTETSLAEIQAGKADKKEVAGELSGMDSKLDQVQKDLKASLEKMSADIKSLGKKVADEFAKTADTVNNVTTSVAECQADIVLMRADKADKREVDFALKNQDKRLQDQTNQLLKSLEAKMASINASILELEKLKSAVEKNPSPPAAKKSGPPALRKSDQGSLREETLQE